MPIMRSIQSLFSKARRSPKFRRSKRIKIDGSTELGDGNAVHIVLTTSDAIVTSTRSLLSKPRRPPTFRRNTEANYRGLQKGGARDVTHIVVKSSDAIMPSTPSSPPPKGGLQCSGDAGKQTIVSFFISPECCGSASFGEKR